MDNTYRYLYQKSVIDAGTRAELSSITDSVTYFSSSFTGSASATLTSAISTDYEVYSFIVKGLYASSASNVPLVQFILEDGTTADSGYSSEIIVGAGFTADGEDGVSTSIELISYFGNSLGTTSSSSYSGAFTLVCDHTNYIYNLYGVSTSDVASPLYTEVLGSIYRGSQVVTGVKLTADSGASLTGKIALKALY
jgi:hypothetical protein